MELEKVGEGRLVVETQLLADLANRHVGIAQQPASLVVGQQGEVVADGVAGNLLYDSRKVGGGHVQLVGIERQRPLLSEVVVGQMDEDSEHILLVVEVVGEHFLGVGQLIEEQQAHVEQRPQDFVPVDCPVGG